MSTNKKILVALAASIAVSSVAADDCTGGPWQVSSGLLSDPVATSSATDPDIELCAGLKANAQVCCTTATIDGIQTLADDLSEQIATEASARDEAFVAAAKTATNTTTITTTVTEYAAALAAFTTKVDNYYDDPENSGASGSVDQFNAIITALNEELAGDGTTTAAEAVVNVATELGEVEFTFESYQKNRASCANQLLDVQASLWCAVCDPAATTKGFTADEGVSIGATTCKRLSDGCYQYVVESQVTNGIFELASLINAFDAIATVMTDAAPGNLEEFENDLDTAVNTAQDGADGKFIRGQLPDDCTSSTNCQSWICSNFINTEDAKINVEAFIIGGEPIVNLAPTPTPTPAPDRRLDAPRNLAGTFAPAQGASGVTADFPEDPADVAAEYAEISGAPGNPVPETNVTISNTTQTGNSAVVGFGSVAAAVMMVTGAMML